MSDVLLAKKWEDEDPTGWWMSEKLDGVRAVWRNGEFYSRGDNTYVCPDWFKRKMPAGCVLDGEVWGGRGQFQKTVGIVRSSSRQHEWEFLTYMVFDCLQEGGMDIENKPFEMRLEAVKRACAGRSDVAKPVPMERCESRASLDTVLSQVEKRGGEGLMLRCPGSRYERKRSKTLLKVKTFYDEEAIVVGHAGGTGRVAGMCGALLCETPDKRRFKVGSGLSDAQRRNPPEVNAVITYRYQELTADNIPRFPTLVGERVDMTWSQICGAYVPPGPRKDSALKKTHSILFDGPAAAPAPIAGPPALRRGLTAMDARQLGTAEEDLDDFGFEDMIPPAPPPEKKLRLSAAADIAATASGKKSVCPYGQRCYRKNPAHFLEFEHPWRDEENEMAAAPASPAPEAAAQAPAAAANLEDLFGAETQPAREEALQRHDKAVVEPGDMRLAAVRNLLLSMMQDARPDARDHLQRMLEFADSVPTDVPKAASSGLPRSLASVLLSTSTSEALGAIAGEAPGKGRPRADPQAKLANELANMGFAQDAVQEALAHCSTADDAVDWLLARSS